MRFSLPATLAFSLIACAAAKTPTVTREAPGPAAAAAKDASGKPTLASNAGGPPAQGKYVCTFEEETGSHQRTKVCRYLDDQSVARQRVQDTVREEQSHSPRGQDSVFNLGPGRGH